MYTTKEILYSLLDGQMRFEDLLDIEKDLAEIMKINNYTKPLLHKEIPITMVCMNLVQSIKVANCKFSTEVPISSFYENPLCQFWLNKAEAALDVSSEI